MTRNELKVLRKMKQQGVMLDFNIDKQVRAKNAQQTFNMLWSDGVNCNKRPIADILHTGSWRGRRCFILAGGPSLSGFDFKSLENELTIGINRVYEVMDCSIMFCMDGRFYKFIHGGSYGAETLRRFKEYQGVKVWMDIANMKLNGVFFSRSLGQHGLIDTLEGGLYHGNNSGYGAFQLAWALGADPIYLLGYDMKFEKGRGHYHDGHPVPFKESMMASFMETFKKMTPKIRASGRKVYNCNPKSALRCFPFADLPDDINTRLRPVFTTFFTTGYERHANCLRDDLWRRSLRCHVEQIGENGSWTANCHQKPVFLLKMLDRYKPSPVVWLDADARIIRDPVLFENINTDFACHYRRRKGDHGFYKAKELLSGTLYFKNTSESRQLLNMWIAENKRNPSKWDQRNLDAAVKKWKGTVTELPAPYCQIFDTMKNEGGAPVIQHFQASRKLRRGGMI